MATLTELKAQLLSLNTQLSTALATYNTKTHLGNGYFLYTKISITNNSITPFTYGLESQASLDVNNIPKLVLKRFATALQRLIAWANDTSVDFPTFTDLEQP